MAAGATRLFFALWPDEAARSELDGWARALHQVAGGRRVPAGNLHLTIAFLGATDPARIAELNQLAGGLSAPRFDLHLEQSGYWKHKRIAWAGTREVPAGLVGLVEQLRAALAEGGFAFDPKPFAPHVTLLRNARTPHAIEAMPPVAWAVNSFSLVRSESAERGVAYWPLSSWPLA